MRSGGAEHTDDCRHRIIRDGAQAHQWPKAAQVLILGGTKRTKKYLTNVFNIFER